MERGHTVCLSSSALTIQVEPVARFLGITNTLTNRFEVDDDGVLTGEVVTPDPVGTGQGQRRPEVRRRHTTSTSRTAISTPTATRTSR